MKVLHITNEFTKKNFSISSLIIYISAYLNINYKINYSILTSSLEKNLFKTPEIDLINFNSWHHYFTKKKKLQEIFKNYEVIHIHGIWAPIQLISLLVCNNLKKTCMVHPHGMLLDEAVKSAGFIKFILKKFTLYCLKFLINKNIRFISITNQETAAINKYFPTSKVNEISNPIPFDVNEVENKKIKKIVYFGRLHPHKNLELVIDSFISSNISNDWRLEIYGIRDDENYYGKLKKKIQNHSNIQIKDPIFGLEKQKIMKESWLNILVSKSEVLSLSILESGLFGLPSLVNEDIEIKKGLEKTIIFTKPSTIDISKKIKEISQWTLEKRNSVEIEVINSAKEATSIEKISSKYNEVYNEIEEGQVTFGKDLYKAGQVFDFLNIKKNLNFILVSGAYTFNLMFASLLVISLVILGYYSTAGELGLITSLWITTTQIFSSNMRSIIVSEQKEYYAKISLVYRFILSIILLLIFYLIVVNFFDFENHKLIIITSILIMIQWVNEMKLVQFELNNKIYYFKIFLTINLITIFLTSFFLIINRVDLLEYLLIFYSFIILISLFFDLTKLSFKRIGINFKTIITLNLKTIAFASSFSIIISSFAWRIMIYYIFDKSLAGIFFACFSFGSFPGTLFNAVIGPAFIKSNIQISRGLKKIFFFLFTVALSINFLSIYYLINLPKINYIGYEFVVFTISISLIGSFFMSYAMYLRHKRIQKSEQERVSIFKRDIVYGIAITFIIPFLYYFGGVIAVSFSFLFASLMAYFSYSINYTNIDQSKYS